MTSLSTGCEQKWAGKVFLGSHNRSHPKSHSTPSGHVPLTSLHRAHRGLLRRPMSPARATQVTTSHRSAQVTPTRSPRITSRKLPHFLLATATAAAAATATILFLGLLMTRPPPEKEKELLGRGPAR